MCKKSKKRHVSSSESSSSSSSPSSSSERRSPSPEERRRESKRKRERSRTPDEKTRCRSRNRDARKDKHARDESKKPEKKSLKRKHRSRSRSLSTPPDLRHSTREVRLSSPSPSRSNKKSKKKNHRSPTPESKRSRDFSVCKDKSTTRDVKNHKEKSLKRERRRRSRSSSSSSVSTEKRHRSPPSAGKKEMDYEQRYHPKDRSSKKRRRRSSSSSSSEIPDKKRRSNQQTRERATSKDDKENSSTPAPEKEQSVTSKQETPEDNDDDFSGDMSIEAVTKMMQKRKEKLEKWRAEQAKLLKDKKDSEESDSKTAASCQPDQQHSAVLPPFGKNENDDDDDDVNENDEAAPANDNGSGSEIDPLDAYMASIAEEANQSKKVIKTNETTSRSTRAAANVSNVKVTVVTGVAKKPLKSARQKGVVVETDGGAVEFLSEGEDESLDAAMMKLSKTKKDLVAVDHSKIYYRPFRKNFYVEVPEITSMTQKEVDDYREQLDKITVKGQDCPRPIKSWAQCGINKNVLDHLQKSGLNKPTPIQSQALPVIMSGRDMIGIAKTGSGKTLAFLVPMFRHIMDQPELEKGDGPIAIIMTPIRELAIQIRNECKKIAKFFGLTVACVYGGAETSEQIKQLKRGAEIVVCTPGRMIDMLGTNTGHITNLRRCTYVVLDEADRMFDSGFEPQVTKIVSSVRPDKQLVMFSATFPRSMEALAKKTMNRPVLVMAGVRSAVCSDVEQHVIVVDDDQKFCKLLELLGIYQDKGSVIVFVHKQEDADALMNKLMKHAYPCLLLHGGIEQADREMAIMDFKSGGVKLLVATSVCARGLDVKDLVLVVNYDCPNHYEDYVHRCGRTGRAGNSGYAYTFLAPDQGKYAGDIIKALTVSQAPVPSELSDIWDKYVKDMEAEGKKVYTASGFKGKGFKFDETEAQLAGERKKQQKAVLGLQDSDDEESDQKIDEKIEKVFASNNTRLSEESQTSAAATTLSTASNLEKLELARRAAEQINIRKNFGPESSNSSHQILMNGEASSIQVSSKTLAEQMVEKLNAKLGYCPPIEEKEKNAEPEPVQAVSSKRYEEELEINDFPQTARWKVTSRETLSQISEYSEAGITVRGTYFPQNKKPKDDERRLYLFIEATSETSIQRAKTEITRLIKEELVRLGNSHQPIDKSRYKVI